MQRCDRVGNYARWGVRLGGRNAVFAPAKPLRRNGFS
ncbi:hypothetical protein XOCgx_2663 [Xanthomonas oryzae pv. oryzicola]|nr:hypothetical protein XOCgx_2663 [Xanthomonas oryzae pv. oryzicola]